MAGSVFAARHVGSRGLYVIPVGFSARLAVDVAPAHALPLMVGADRPAWRPCLHDREVRTLGRKPGIDDAVVHATEKLVLFGMRMLYEKTEEIVLRLGFHHSSVVTQVDSIIKLIVIYVNIQKGYAHAMMYS